MIVAIRLNTHPKPNVSCPPRRDPSTLSALPVGTPLRVMKTSLWAVGSVPGVLFCTTPRDVGVSTDLPLLARSPTTKYDCRY